MSWAINRVSDPAEEALTTTDAKKHLRVEHTDDDTYIGTLSQAWREWLEEETNRSFVLQTWDYFQDEFPDASNKPIEVPRGPVLSVTSVKYTTVTSTVAQTLAATAYMVDTASEPARISLKDGQTWPVPILRNHNGVEVRYTAGYATSATGAIPQRIKQALRLLVGDSYVNREALAVGVGITPNPAAKMLVKQLNAKRYM